MADNTYQTKVYHKQGGDELVIADGGQLTIESSGGIEIESGATVEVESGGQLEVESGGSLEIESGGYFSAVGDFYLGSLSAISPTYLGAIILNRLNVLTVTNSAGAGSGVLSVVSIPARTGFVIIKASGACSNGSIQLYSCYKGEELLVYCHSNATLNSASVAILASGGGAVRVSLVGIRGSVLSRVRLDFSAMQSAWVKFRAIADACWAVVDSSAYATEDAYV